MSPEEREMLRKALELSQENNKMLHALGVKDEKLLEGI